jgi:hypothetical protein
VIHLKRGRVRWVERSEAPYEPVPRGRGHVGSGGSMNTDDSRIIARFQRLTTELLVQKRLGEWHPELVDELYRTSLEIEERGLKKTLEYRDAMVRAYEEACWLAELAKLTGTVNTS